MKEFVSLRVAHVINTIYLENNYTKIKFEIGKAYYEFGFNNDPNSLKLSLLQIHDDYKNKGFAKYMIMKIIEYWKDMSLNKIYVLASPFGPSKEKLNLEQLIRFYTELGFKESEIQNHNTNLNREMYYQYPKSF